MRQWVEAESGHTNYKGSVGWVYTLLRMAVENVEVCFLSYGEW